MPRKVGTLMVAGGWIWKKTLWVWKHQAEIVATIEKVGPKAKTVVISIKDSVTGYKFCRDCEKYVIDSRVAKLHKWKIARQGERCKLCELRADAHGHPIPGTGRSNET